jgi:hypothetical protein
MAPLENRTKMFHVKHFGTIGAGNLTSAYPRAGLRHVGLRGKLVVDAR